MIISMSSIPKLVLLIAALLMLGEYSSAADQCDDELMNYNVRRVPAGRTKSNPSAGQKHRDNVAVARSRGKKLQFVLYGDSITERWSANSAAMNVMRSKYEAAALGISGDEVEDLLYRLQNGEFQDGMSPSFVSILIGINNVRDFHQEDGKAYEKPQRDSMKCADTIVASIKQIVAFIHQRTCRTQIILNGMLPTAQWLDDWDWPNLYTETIERTNRLIEDFAKEHKNLHFVNCGVEFLESTRTRGKYTLKEDWMGDKLHPDGPGQIALAKCVLAESGRILQEIAQNNTQPSYGPCSVECGGGAQRLISCSVNSSFLEEVMGDRDFKQVEASACSGVPGSQPCNIRRCPTPALTQAQVPTNKTTAAPAVKVSPVPAGVAHVVNSSRLSLEPPLPSNNSAIIPGNNSAPIPGSSNISAVTELIPVPREAGQLQGTEPSEPSPQQSAELTLIQVAGPDGAVLQDNIAKQTASTAASMQLPNINQLLAPSDAQPIGVVDAPGQPQGLSVLAVGIIVAAVVLAVLVALGVSLACWCCRAKSQQSSSTAQGEKPEAVKEAQSNGSSPPPSPHKAGTGATGSSPSSSECRQSNDAPAHHLMLAGMAVDYPATLDDTEDDIFFLAMPPSHGVIDERARLFHDAQGDCAPPRPAMPSCRRRSSRSGVDTEVV